MLALPKHLGKAKHAAACRGVQPVTHFLQPLSAGRVDVEAVPLSQGRTQQLWRVDITDESGKLIAHGEVRLQNVAGQAAA